MPLAPADRPDNSVTRQSGGLDTRADSRTQDLQALENNGGSQSLLFVRYAVRVVVLPSANTTATPWRFDPVPEIEIAGVATEAIFSPTHHPKTENY